jgi:hypothetical protein
MACTILVARATKPFAAVAGRDESARRTLPRVSKDNTMSLKTWINRPVNKDRQFNDLY